MITNNKKNPIIFPLLDGVRNASDREMVQIFLQTYRDQSLREDDSIVLSAITKTASLVGCSDLLTAKVLTDYGLRAARKNFPRDFVNYIEYAAMMNLPSNTQRDLKEFWDEGEQEEKGMLSATCYKSAEIPSVMMV